GRHTFCPRGAGRSFPYLSLSVYNAPRFLSSANGCNEITVSPYTTKKTKCPQKRHFVVFVGFVAFVIPLGYRGIVISLISLKSCFSGGTVKPLKSLISLGSCGCALYEAAPAGCPLSQLR